jgi:hypothetical protein
MTLPVYLEAGVQSQLTQPANYKGIDFSDLPKALLRNDIELIAMANEDPSLLIPARGL